MSVFTTRLTPSRLLVPSLVVAAVLASAQMTQAKSIQSLGYSNLRTNDAIKMRRGGCAAFGHSCFGGHGKRSESGISPSEPEEAPSGLQLPTDDIRSFLAGGPRTPVEIFSKEQPDADLNLIMPSPYQLDDYMRFSPLFRKWLANSYRRGDMVAVNK